MSAPSSTPTEPVCALRAVGVHRRPAGDVLSDVTLEIASGALLLVTGANGAGKSTLLRVIAGDIAPGAGEVRWLSGRARGLVSYVSQEPELDPEMRAGELLDLVAALWGLSKSARRARAAEILEALGAGSLGRRRIASLSGGERQRVHLAAGLLPPAPLLVLDEPATYLDDTARSALWRHLAAEARNGTAVVVAEHDLGGAAAHATAVIHLQAGRLTSAVPA
jgi:ABC-2 type transport system ATP-binding protein